MAVTCTRTPEAGRFDRSAARKPVAEAGPDAALLPPEHSRLRPDPDAQAHQGSEADMFGAVVRVQSSPVTASLSRHEKGVGDESRNSSRMQQKSGRGGSAAPRRN